MGPREPNEHFDQKGWSAHFTAGKLKVLTLPHQVQTEDEGPCLFARIHSIQLSMAQA